MLPKKYQILPFSIPFSMPEFHFYKKPEDRTLALENIDCEIWFEQFADLVINAIEKREYLPICRLSDGEFTFLVGKQKRFYRSYLKRNLFGLLHAIKAAYMGNKDFVAGEVGLYQSGTYSQVERKDILRTYLKNLKKISQEGILALHFSYILEPFQERFFPAVKVLFDKEGILLNKQNYFPFYFVYALFIGSKRKEILKDRRVLVIHSAVGDKRSNIEKSLEKEGVSSIFWCQISNDRSMFDTVDIENFKDKVDLVFVGAGIGKPNILVQLKTLSVPCIDLGYIFEVWNDEENKFKRAGCATDQDLVNKNENK